MLISIHSKKEFRNNDNGFVLDLEVERFNCITWSFHVQLLKTTTKNIFILSAGIYST